MQVYIRNENNASLTCISYLKISSEGFRTLSKEGIDLESLIL